MGQLPVLRPGQVFEYMSGTDLSSPKGVMAGHFYMATVPNETHCGKAGDLVQALEGGDTFKVGVGQFPLEGTVS